MNSAHVRRMMANLHTSIREPAPEAPAPIRAPRKKKAEPEHIEPESSDSDSGSESEYEEVNKIKSYFEQEPCESISPAALGQTKTTKEALDYLKSKNCPKIANIKKSAKSIKMDGPASPAPETAPAKKVIRKAKAPAPAPAPTPVAPAPVVEAAPKKVRKTKAAAVEAVAAPAPATSAPAAPAKAKRPASEYAKLVGKYVKEKMTFAEAAKKAKAELDAKKKKD